MPTLKNNKFPISVHISSVIADECGLTLVIGYEHWLRIEIFNITILSVFHFPDIVYVRVYK